MTTVRSGAGRRAGPAAAATALALSLCAAPALARGTGTDAAAGTSSSAAASSGASSFGAPSLDAGPSGATVPSATVPAIDPPLLGGGGVLPPVQAPAPVGDVGAAITRTLAGPTLAPQARPWTITPTIGVGEEYTDNLLNTGAIGRGDDFITLLTPGISIEGDSPRLQGGLSYHPIVNLYARHGDQDRVDQDYSGQLLAAVVPGVAFVDLRGFGSVVGNGLGGRPVGIGSGVLNNQSSTVGEATQSTDLALNPYALHRFGPIGTGEIGVGVERITEGGVGANDGTPAGRFAASPFSLPGNQDATTLSGHAAFATGEAFGRYNGTGLVSIAHTSGTGVLSSATHDSAVADNGYAITRNVVALGRVGYEHITYAGTSPVRIDDAVWGVGVRLVLGPQSTVSVRYGHHDGFDSATLDAAFRLTARTALFARYSEGLNTETELLSNALADTDLDQLGDPVDHRNGAPLLLADGFFGAQQNLYRTRLGSITAQLTGERDIVSAGVQVEENRLVSASGVAGSLGNNSGVYGTADWSHQLSPTLTLSVDGQYGERRATGLVATRDDVAFVSVAFAKTLTETLSAQLRYSYNLISTPQFDGRNAANVVLLAIDKSF